MGITFNIHNNFFADLEQKVKSLEGTRKIPFTELFNRQFMMQHTTFNNIDDFLRSAGINVQTLVSFNEFPKEQLDAFVQTHTTFSSWKAMYNTACEDWVTHQLNF